MNKQIKFFYDHAGHSWDPRIETQEQGRARCAADLAKAEMWGLFNLFTFGWCFDADMDSSDFDPDPEPWKLWECTMYDSDGQPVQYLGGIDFGRHGTPWGDSYKRVTEAQQALEQMNR